MLVLAMQFSRIKTEPRGFLGAWFRPGHLAVIGAVQLLQDGRERTLTS